MWILRSEKALYLFIFCSWTNKYFNQSRWGKRVTAQHTNQSGTGVIAQHNNGGPRGCMRVSPPCFAFACSFFIMPPVCNGLKLFYLFLSGYRPSVLRRLDCVSQKTAFLECMGMTLFIKSSARFSLRKSLMGNVTLYLCLCGWPFVGFHFWWTSISPILGLIFVCVCFSSVF